MHIIIKTCISSIAISILSFVNSVNAQVFHAPQYYPSSANSSYDTHSEQRSAEKRFRVVVDQTEAKVRVYEIFGNQAILVRSMPAGVAKNTEWRVRKGVYEISLLAQRYIFTGWGKPAPKAGCGIQITPLDGNPAIPGHPDRVVLFHTEPDSSWHPSHNACRMKNGTFVTSLASAKKVDLFKGRGYRSHGCIRLSAEDARYLFTLALNRGDVIVHVK